MFKNTMKTTVLLAGLGGRGRARRRVGVEGHIHQTVNLGGEIQPIHQQVGIGAGHHRVLAVDIDQREAVPGQQHFEDRQRLLRRHEQFTARHEAFGGERGALLPGIPLRVGDAPFELG